MPDKDDIELLVRAWGARNAEIGLSMAEGHDTFRGYTFYRDFVLAYNAVLEASVRLANIQKVLTGLEPPEAPLPWVVPPR